jgi:hypothetical protein
MRGVVEPTADLTDQAHIERDATSSRQRAARRARRSQIYAMSSAPIDRDAASDNDRRPAEPSGGSTSTVERDRGQFDAGLLAERDRDSIWPIAARPRSDRDGTGPTPAELAHQIHVERDLDQLDIGDQLADLNPQPHRAAARVFATGGSAAMARAMLCCGWPPSLRRLLPSARVSKRGARRHLCSDPIHPELLSVYRLAQPF